MNFTISNRVHEKGIFKFQNFNADSKNKSTKIILNSKEIEDPKEVLIEELEKPIYVNNKSIDSNKNLKNQITDNNSPSKINPSEKFIYSESSYLINNFDRKKKIETSLNKYEISNLYRNQEVILINL